MMTKSNDDSRRGSDLVQPQVESVGVLGGDGPSTTEPEQEEEDSIEIQRAAPVREMIYVLCARAHDSHRVLNAYSSRMRAQAMAAFGDKLEVRFVTKQYIALARAAETDEERDHWAREMLQVRADGVSYWRHYVVEMELV